MNTKQFIVAFSFSGKRREFVESVARILAERWGEAQILYDRFFEAQFARPDLGIHLPDLYHKSSLVVVVACDDYKSNEWCGLEWKSIHALIKERREEEIMLCRFDHAEIKGLYSTAGFVELDNKSPKQIVDLIIQRLDSNGVDLKMLELEAKPFKDTTPNNLPKNAYYRFFGRTGQLGRIKDALSPQARTWGVLIDGSGGIGKTSLAVRAAETVSQGQFRQICFLSAQHRKMTGDGERRLVDFVTPRYLDMLNEIGRLLKYPEFAKLPESERARTLIDTLSQAHVLLILDNLESLDEDDLDRLFEFLSRLPMGCKAIATGRRRSDVDARIIRLGKLEHSAALALINELALDRPLLAKATSAERIHLYEETGGNPLLLRWVAGQLGNGRCRTITSALKFLRSAPPNNNPLKFIFGDLLETFTQNETEVLVALSYFTHPVDVTTIAGLANISNLAAQTALGDLANRALLIPDDEEQHFVLVPMVADFLRNERPTVVEETGSRLQLRAYALIIENGYNNFDRFPVLNAAWPTVASALPLIAAGPSFQLKTVRAAIRQFLIQTDRWEELRFLDIEFSSIPTVELTFRSVAGSPWAAQAEVCFNGQSSGEFDVFEGMTSQQRESVRWYIEEFMDHPEGGYAVTAGKIEQSLDEYGLALWAGLTKDAGVQFESFITAARYAGGGRLELRAATPRDEIAFRTPWELLRVGGGKGTLLHNLGITVVRRGQQNLTPLPKPLDTSDGLRVLAIVCRPNETGFVDPRYTPEAMLDALKNQPEIMLDFCRPGTLNALIGQLETARRDGRPYHVVHFDGHGTTLPHEAGIGALCFEGADEALHLVRATEFGDLMSRFDISLIILGAMRTSTKALARETVSAALLKQGIGSVVAMAYSVHVDMLRTLMGSFYESLAAGQSVGEALQAARNQVYTSRARRVRIAVDAPTVELRDWFVPQLYQSGADPVLLEKKSLRTRRKVAEPLFHAFGLAPKAGFHGRARELHRLERMLLQERVVVVHAPGGMGKTTIAREAASWWIRAGLFPDGAIFVSLEGNRSPEWLITQCGLALEGHDFYKRDDADKRQFLADEFAKRRLLIVWDNFESVLPAFQTEPTPHRPRVGGSMTGSYSDEQSENQAAHQTSATTAPEPFPGVAADHDSTDAGSVGGRLTIFAALADEWTRGDARLLVTCRDAEVRLDSSTLSVRAFALGELNTEEGLMLLVGRLDKLGVSRPEREQRGWTADVLRPIVKGALGHPLALELLTPHILTLGPAEVAKQLGPLLASVEQDHHEARNRSIGFSLDFSIRHLSPAAQAALPAIALLSGGCLENMAAMVVGLDETEWPAVRAEFERTGLVRIEDGWLRPHPVLDTYDVGRIKRSAPPATEDASDAECRNIAALGPAYEGDEELHNRFRDVVFSLCAEFDKLVRTPQSKQALSVLGGSEVVVRRAIALATARSQLEPAVDMANSLKLFLELTGRGSEGAALMTELASHSDAGSVGGELTQVAATLLREAAWARARTEATAAADDLTRLLDRFDRVEHWDTRFERAQALRDLGRVHLMFEHRPAAAIEPLEAAVALFAELEGDRRSTTNRAATLGDLANAFRALGRFDEALAAAEQGLALNRQRNDQSAAARGLGRIAQILQQQGNYPQAEQRYHEALSAAREAGDTEAIGILWQGLGNMHLDRKHPDKAVPALRKALDAFAEAGDVANQMRTLIWLGEADRYRGHPEAALAWYERSLALAEQLGDLQGQATTRSNRAILLSDQAQALLGDGGSLPPLGDADDAAAGSPSHDEARRLLNQAIAEERECLAIQQQLGHPASISISHNNLADYLRLSGQLNDAEQHARAALDIREQLNDPRTHQTLNILRKIAEASGDATAAAVWRTRRDAAYADAQRRAGTPSLPPELIASLLSVALTAREHAIPLPDALASAGVEDGAAYLNQLDTVAAWLPPHLHALARAAGTRPATDVPAQYQDLINEAWTATK
jgi:tetratricopeptide (TPR) repeat protein